MNIKGPSAYRVYKIGEEELDEPPVVALECKYVDCYDIKSKLSFLVWSYFLGPNIEGMNAYHQDSDWLDHHNDH